MYSLCGWTDRSGVWEVGACLDVLLEGAAMFQAVAALGDMLVCMWRGRECFA